jgi:hypothetical protein
VNAEPLVRRESPGLYVVHLVGEVGAGLPRALYDEVRRTIDGDPFVLLLVHVARIGRVDPRARHGAIEEARAIPLRGVAFVGASFPFRALATLVHNAGNLLGGKADNQLRFFADEPAARAWLAARAAELGRGG